MAETPLAAIMSPEMEKLFMWSDLKTSGIVLGGTTAGYLLLEKSGFTIVSLVANFLLVAVIAIFTWSNVATVFNLPPPPLQKFEISSEQAGAIATTASSAINSTLEKIFSVLLGKDAIATVKLAGLLYFIGKIGGYFHSLTLVYIIIVLLFSLPKAYMLKKKEVDEVVAMLMEHVNKYVNIAQSVVQEKIKALKPKAVKEGEKKTE